MIFLGKGGFFNANSNVCDGDGGAQVRELSTVRRGCSTTDIVWARIDDELALDAKPGTHHFRLIIEILVTITKNFEISNHKVDSYLIS